MIADLTRSQEKLILDYLANNPDYLSHGSSRLVFEVTKTLRDTLINAGVDLPTDRELVVKVLFGEGGVIQQTRECDIYAAYADTDCFARIFYSGVMVIIAEYINIDDELVEWCCCNYDDLVHIAHCGDNVEDVYDFDDDAVVKSPEDLKAIIHVMEVGTSLFGFTGDLGQIGYNYDGQFVLFDYGYIGDSDSIQTAYHITDAVSYDLSLLRELLAFYSRCLDDAACTAQDIVNWSEDTFDFEDCDYCC